jgi:glutamate synthase domain-containing protein 1
MRWHYEKEISGCGLCGFIHTDGQKSSGDVIVRAICHMDERGNGLGAGFAAYGIYPEYHDLYALQMMYGDMTALSRTEDFIQENLHVEHQEHIPHRHIPSVKEHPRLRRYFVRPKRDLSEAQLAQGLQVNEDDYMVRIVMAINQDISGAFVVSSGKNMGAFKGVGYPEQMADFYRIDEYEAYLWTAHTRFPTNTPGWWGGAHPFTILDWSIVHNGEISSYGINRRYLEMFGYHCTLQTDTEVVAYLLDLLIRRHGLSKRLACMALAPPLWEEIERMPPNGKALCRALRMTYGSALLNGPFAILFADSQGLVGLNDRIKLRPLIAAEHDAIVYMASEESAIRSICPDPERVWAPKAGEPVIATLKETPFDHENRCQSAAL